MLGPSPDDPHPMKGFPQVGFLKPLVKNPNTVVDEYSYYDDPDGPEHFEAKCVLYHFPFIGDKLVLPLRIVLAQGRAHCMFDGDVDASQKRAGSQWHEDNPRVCYQREHTDDNHHHECPGR